MKRAAFAILCGISKQMVSKYAAFLVEEAGEVDALASLAALEGRLDETKRQAALAALEGVQPSRPTAPGAASVPLSAKAQKDEVELQLKRLQYAREAGEVMSVDEIDAAARQAIADMREAFGNRRREIAEAVCLQFSLPSDKASAMARTLAREFEATLGVFAARMAALAAPNAHAHAAQPASVTA